MTWVATVLPAVIIVLGVRVEARLIGPYWSWLELTTWHWPDTARSRRLRREALLRRFLIPLTVGFVHRYVGWSTGPLDGVVIGLLGGAVLVWPALSEPFGGDYLLGRWKQRLLYSAFVGMVASATAAGSYLAEVVQAEGGAWAFLQEQAAEVALALVLGLFLLGRIDRFASGAQESSDIENNPSRVSPPIPLVVARRLTKAAASSTTWRWARTVSDRVPESEHQLALVEILIVETSERPAWMRAVEWAAATPRRLLGRPTTRTLGPLQLRDAPWNRHDAVDRAARHLRDCHIDVLDTSALARCWYGAQNRQAGSSVTYSDALDFAARRAADVLQTLRPDRDVG